jgi:hypothetical protein
VINEYAGDVAGLENRYRTFSDDELLQLSIEGGLSAEARTVLQTEMRRRSLGTKDIEELKNWEEQQKPPPPPPQRVFLGYGMRVVGRKYLSQEDESQGVFTATKFVVLKGVSFFPVGSYRMKQVPNEFPQIENRVPLQWDQVWSGVKPALFATLIGFTLAVVVIYFKERR